MNCCRARSIFPDIDEFLSMAERRIEEYNKAKPEIESLFDTKKVEKDREDETDEQEMKSNDHRNKEEHKQKRVFKRQSKYNKYYKKFPRFIPNYRFDSHRPNVMF